jgi:hypothetical protein
LSAGEVVDVNRKCVTVWMLGAGTHLKKKTKAVSHNSVLATRFGFWKIYHQAFRNKNMQRKLF